MRHRLRWALGLAGAIAGSVGLLWSVAPLPGLSCWHRLAISSIDDDNLLFAAEKHAGRGPTRCISELSLSGSCSELGIAALTLQALEHISLCLALGAVPELVWTQCSHCGPVDGTNYAAEWYFELPPPPPPPGLHVTTSPSLICLGDATCFGTPFLELPLHRPGKLGAQLGAVREEGHQLMLSWLPMNRDIVASADDFAAVHFASARTVVGVQIRGTDKWLEIPGHQLPALERWVDHVQRVVSSRPGPVVVFIAADNDQAIRTLRQRLTGCRLVNTSASRAESYTGTAWVDPVREGKQNGVVPAGRARTVGSQVLIDAVLLAKAHVLIHDESSVATLAALLNPEMSLAPLKIFSEGGGDGGQDERDKQARDEEDDPNSPDPAREACFQASRPFSQCKALRRDHGVSARSAVKRVTAW